MSSDRDTPGQDERATRRCEACGGDGAINGVCCDVCWCSGEVPASWWWDDDGTLHEEPRKAALV